MSERGARSSADINPAHLTALHAGTAAARTLTEALAIDHTVLLRNAIPHADDELLRVVAGAQALGILKRMMTIGAALAERTDAIDIEQLAHHPSDTVRGWGCFQIAARQAPDPVSLLEQLRGFADDEHFAVREWVWMAARPALVADLATSIDALTGWTADPSANVRRFASEALRPRGVWASHIAALKEHPSQGEPILEPLRSDPSRYVQDSVANWINDAAKTRPDWALGLCARWRAESSTPETVRITGRALRSIT